jgi:hypothetical protein
MLRLGVMLECPTAQRQPVIKAIELALRMPDRLLRRDSVAACGRQAAGHRGLRMVMRYAHLSPAYLSEEVGLLDPAAPAIRKKGQKKGNVPLRAISEKREWWNLRREMAPQVGLEPTTLRLTAAILTIDRMSSTAMMIRRFNNLWSMSD